LLEIILRGPIAVIRHIEKIKDRLDELDAISTRFGYPIRRPWK